MRKNGQKILAVVLALSLLMTMTINVFALDEEDAAGNTENQTSFTEVQNTAIETQPGNSDTIGTTESTETATVSTAQNELKLAISEDSTIADNTYQPDSFTFTGGSGKVTITCPSVKITGSNATAKIVFSSKSYTQLTTGGKTYKGYIDAAAGTSTYYVPAEINKDYTVVGVTTAMSKVTSIEYVLNIKLTKDSIITSEPGFTSPGINPIDSDTYSPLPSEPPTPGDPAKEVDLADGTYLVNVKTDEKMFYIQPYNNKILAKVTKAGGEYTATITLTGQGYDYLFMGTASEAEAAAGAQLIKYSASNGYYSYTFEFSQFDKELQIAARSQKYSKWYDHTILFYSAGATKTSEDINIIPKKSNEVKNTIESDNTNVNPAAVDNSTNLKDGSYKVDRFSWSGGSGRLAYIKCTGITVKNGKAFVRIVFSSSSYDKVKASGKTFSKSGGGFKIPVKLNSNNTIAGRTVAMSSPHWVAYTIFIYSDAAAKAGDGNSLNAGGEISQNKLAKRQPSIPGFENMGELKVEKAKSFKVFNYDMGVKLIQIDITKHSGLKYSTKGSNEPGMIEYEEDGKPVAKTINEIIEDIYHHNVVNYLVVPDGVEIPAGIEKECVILNGTEIKSQVSSKQTRKMLKEIGAENAIEVSCIESDKDKNNYVGSYKKPIFSKIINEKVNLNILPSRAIPKIKTDTKKIQKLKLIEKRYATIEIPVLFDCSQLEKNKLAEAEWVKVYGSIFDKQDEAVKYFERISDGEKVQNEK